MLYIRPTTLKDANEYVSQFHRHHGTTAGCKFAIKVVDNDGVIHGVAICGRPVSRFLDTGEVLEINRVCADGCRNACSMLYGACCRIAKNMGYAKVITYILQSELGTSLQASGFTLEKENVGGVEWTGKRQMSRSKQPKIPHELKKRYCKMLR